MKLAIIALVLAVSLAQTEAWWGYGMGMYGGLYGMMGMGMWGGWGMGMWGKRSTDEKVKVPKSAIEALKRTECVYTKETDMLSCKAPTGIVECEVDMRFPVEKVDFKLFGITQVSESPISFELVPRKLDNTAWDWFMVNGKKVVLSLWSSDAELTGLKVEESVCWEKMVTLLKTSVRSEKIFVQGQATVILGDLLLADKLPKMSEKEMKRWYGYGGYGGYGMGYGGYGMGYGYYGKRTGMPAMNEEDIAKIYKKTMKKAQLE